jgi:hypothetical protein
MKVSMIMALIASTSAITLTNPRVDNHNWPGVILAGDHAIMPITTSSFVDDDFNPMFNKFRYHGSLAQVRHNVRQELSAQLRSALIQEGDMVPDDDSNIQLTEICETVECARQ